MSDFIVGQTIDRKFTTRNFATGVPDTLGDTPAVVAYVGNDTTPITAGITLSVDFDGIVGLNNVRIVATAANGYIPGCYSLVITAGEVDGVSVIGEAVDQFTIEQDAAFVGGIIRKNTATAGAASTITLDGSASSVDDFYNGTTILIQSGTGVGQARVITDYNGTSKVATVAAVWATNPASDSVFIILASGQSVIDANIVAINSDTVAAENLKAALDGSGYNVGGGAIVVESVTGDLPFLDEIIPDSTPADGSRPSVREGILLLTRFLAERSVSGLTMTVYKEDGTTGVMTFTLNSATAPTSITRAS